MYDLYHTLQTLPSWAEVSAFINDTSLYYFLMNSIINNFKLVILASDLINTKWIVNAFRQIVLHAFGIDGGRHDRYLAVKICDRTSYVSVLRKF